MKYCSMNTFVSELDWVSGNTKWADAVRLPCTQQCRLCLRDGSLSKAHDDESCQDSKDCGFEIPWMSGASVKKQRDRFALLGLKRPPKNTPLTDGSVNRAFRTPNAVVSAARSRPARGQNFQAACSCALMPRRLPAYPFMPASNSKSLASF